MATLSQCRIISNPNPIGVGVCNRNVGVSSGTLGGSYISVQGVSMSPAAVPESVESSAPAYSCSHFPVQQRHAFELQQVQPSSMAGATSRVRPAPGRTDLSQPLFVDTSVEYEISGAACPPPDAGHCLLMVHPLYHEFLRHWRLQRGACRCRVCNFYGCRAGRAAPDPSLSSRSQLGPARTAGSAGTEARQLHVGQVDPSTVRYEPILCSDDRGWTINNTHVFNTSHQPLLRANEIRQKQFQQQEQQRHQLQKQQQEQQRQRHLEKQYQHLQEQQLRRQNLQEQQLRRQNLQEQQLRQQHLLSYTCVLPNISCDSSDSGFASVEPDSASVVVDSCFLPSGGGKRPRAHLDPQPLPESGTSAEEEGFYGKRHCSSFYQHGGEWVRYR